MGLVALSSDNTASLMGQLQNIAKKENCVHSVIGEYACGVVRMVREERDPDRGTSNFNNLKHGNWVRHCLALSFFKMLVEIISISV